MKIETFLSRQRCGAILRVFATKEEDIFSRVCMTAEAAERMLSITIGGHQAIRRIDFLVWADPRYRNSDCGKTAQALRAEFTSHPAVNVSEVRHGDLYCALLNYGVAKQLRHRIDYSLIVSGDAYRYVNEETIRAMFEAACAGALAVGVALYELTESILEGRLANTLCLWENSSLLTVGGFDFSTAIPPDDRLTRYLRGWSEETGEVVYYPDAGVEEVIPLARMIEMFGPCVAPILPQGEGVQRYEVPDSTTQRELYQRHVSKMGTKLERQTAHLATIGVDPSFLKGGIIPAYRYQS